MPTPQPKTLWLNVKTARVIGFGIRRIERWMGIGGDADGVWLTDCLPSIRVLGRYGFGDRYQHAVDPAVLMEWIASRPQAIRDPHKRIDVINRIHKEMARFEEKDASDQLVMIAPKEEDGDES